MADVKITYSTVLTKVIEGVALTEEEVEKVKALKASIEKKSAKKAEKKVSDYDVALREAMLVALADGAKTVGELIATGTLPTPEGAVLSSQKVTSAYKALVEEGKVTTSKDKGKTYIALV